ncbi:MAG: protein kinase [Alphaproteobacteria bacterium]|nr:protein kinase [Alphaproteobacteria bacterium]
MGRTYYCARCLNSFAADIEACPNLACGAPRPQIGWGRLLQRGDLLDRHYSVHERVAVGGAGITYRCREIDDDGEEVGPELAIKVLLQSDGTFLRRLGNEARVLQELDHAHIVRSRGFVHRAGKPAYLVTLYEAGGNLYDHVRHTGALPVRTATAIVEQILDALMMAHRRGVVHRDLKPQNVLLREVTARDAVPHVLVADFGIAKLSGFMGDGLTTVGTFVGTPEFAAPEQFKGMPPEPSSDVYAAACVLWFCLTGEPPVRFVDRSDIVACLQTLRGALPPKLPEGSVAEPMRGRLDTIFERTLRPNPAERWSIAALLDALASVDLPDEDFGADIGGLGPTPPSPDLAAPMGTLSPEGLIDPMATPVPEGPSFDAPTEPAVPPPRDELVLATPSADVPADRPRRLRLNAKPEPGPVNVEVHSPPAASGMDALFDSAMDGTVEVVNRRERDTGSLEDLFAPPPSRPTPVEPPAYTDASWETLSGEPAAPVAPVPTAPAPSTGGPAPAWAPESPAPLPDPLPTDDTALLEVVGSCLPAQRSRALAALADPARAVGAIGGSASIAALCGACLAVAEHAIEGRAAWCRTLLTHADANVRATATLAVGATGKAGQLTQLNRMLADPSATVRLAAVHALAGLGARTGRADLVDGWLGAVASDPDPRVRDAAKR